MEILISSRSSIPIYEQITTQIKAMIISGELQDEELLPSVRNLGRQLHISVIKVKRAYDDLQKEGLIKTVVGKGTFVISQNNDKTERINAVIENKLDDIVALAWSRQSRSIITCREESLQHFLPACFLLHFNCFWCSSDL